jgi:hypothetical protein
VIRTIILSLAAVVMLSSTSHASFVFSFAQSTADVQLDGTVDVDLIVSNTMMTGTDTLSQYSISIEPSTIGNITLPSSTLTAAGVSITVAANDFAVLGSYTFNASSADKDETVNFVPVAGGAFFTATSTFGLITNATFDGSLAVTAVPEPTSLVMFGSVIGLGLLRRRR